MRKSLPIIFIFLAINFSAFEKVNAQPSNTDYVLAYGGAALYISSEFLFKENLSPDKPNWSHPPDFDTFFRNHLKWQDENLNTAALYSDILLKGVFIPSIFWSPLLTDYDYNKILLLNVQVAAATGILTNLAKFITGRERPYAYFDTHKPQGADDNLSFFSGHSSFTFALATSTSMLMEKKYHEKSGLIWSSSIFMAALTGWLRIASDRHYISDVLTGAVIGTLSGYIITKNQRNNFFKTNNSNANMTFYFTLSL